MIPIPTGYAYNLFNGDVVGLTGGGLAVTTYGFNTTAAAGVGIGVFVGCEYTNTSSAGVPQGPIYGKNRYQYWQGGTNAQDAIGYVVDDPNAYFRVAVLTQPVTTAVNTPGTSIGYMSQAFLGTNVYLITNSTNGGNSSGSTATGDSAMGVTGTAPPTASSINGNVRFPGTATPFRVIQLVPDTAVTVQTTVASQGAAGTGDFVVTSATGIQPGMQVIIPSGNTGTSGSLAGNFLYVTSVVGTRIYCGTSSSATSNANLTVTAGTNVTFVGYPEVIVGWNPTFHAYNVSTGI
jgi:hypothetical protein